MCEASRRVALILRFKRKLETHSTFPQSELMSAALDTPLNGLGVIPLVSTVPGLNNSLTCVEALSTLMNACRGELCPETHTLVHR